MRAIEYAQTGTADVLRLVDREPRAPGAGEVAIRIVVSGVNPTDWKSRQGTAPGIGLAVPQVPGHDGAGTIEALGAGVTSFAIGDRVWVWNAAYQRAEGTAQEIANVPQSQVVALPDNVSFDVGASIGIPAITAHRALTAREGGPEQLARGSLDGTFVLVTGGAGAVGHAAIQFAVWAGATVLTTVSGPDKAKLAEAAGAHHVINYRTEDVAERVRAIAKDGVEVIAEVNAAVNLGLDLTLLRVGGTIASYAGTPADEATFPVRAAMSANARLQFLLTYLTSDAQKRAAVDATTAALQAGALGIGAENGLPIIRFPLERAADAQRAVEAGTVGKVLIDVRS
ncbi:MAG TPA: NADPH:quinone reductase [Galbitalea sp.]|jgi:NADPH2:quinone reductase|nr:NADPH:quinone reductase [Galbitalea sp.]